ncbi:Cysteine dioxygenase type I [Cupriavidus phytorum]|uniref:Cysteine dioxygenase type I n=1 Tax=Cupriavidus taiwanensis TaxID=164546 RepID=A0A975XM16_9BURK|nr:cysteine dioxygenase [Cupriavidus taiwanensis]SOY74669.1 Cysteine dioxygenase type I [Cupriavidus taiwanensis]
MNLPKVSTDFIAGMTRIVDTAEGNERRILDAGEKLLGELIAVDDWLPEAYAQPHPQYYGQYLLYADPGDRFSVVSFVWGPGQKTPVHDHTVWALIGMLRGAETSERFEVVAPGKPMRSLGKDMLRPGHIDRVSPSIGDIHRVANAYDDSVSISIHVYGGNIGKISRHVYDEQSGEQKTFISGYTNV